MNYVFYLLVLVSFLAAAVTGRMEAVTLGIVEGAKSAVTLAIGLVGVMALFLGLMQVMQEAGALRFIARMIRPVMVRMFPDVPPEHPAMAAMIMNLAANALGLANAATPFGIKAMQELDKLNGRKGTATNAMALFLAINTSAVTLLPTGVIGLRASLGSQNAAAILPSTLFASGCATLFGVLGCLLYARLPYFARTRPPLAEEGAALVHQEGDDLSRGARDSLLPFCGLIAALIALVVLAILYGDLVSNWVIPTLVVGMLTVGKLRGVKVYEVFIEGAKDGFNVALRIIPYVVAILVAVAMFRESGAMGILVGGISVVTAPLGLPAEALPMVLLRPLSGSGAYGVMADALKTYGTDTYVGYLVSTLQGSSETVFYVLAVYFGAIGVSRYRHTMFAALTADLAGVIGAVFICRWLFT